MIEKEFQFGNWAKIKVFAVLVNKDDFTKVTES